MSRALPILLMAVTFLIGAPKAAAQQTQLGLDLPGAAGDWAFTDSNARIADGELVLDGRLAKTMAFYKPHAWEDVSLRARFMVEPADKGVLACGFAVRAKNGSEFYYVHFDKGQAILCRSTADSFWNEIKRVSGLDKPAGQWHEGRLDCQGNTLRVYLNGELLYEAQDSAIESGRIGFYANQGKAHVKDIVVTGNAKEPEAPFTMPAPEFVYVCQDAGAGGYEAFPDVCRLHDGRLMAVFYAGYGHVSLPNEQLPEGGRLAYCMSSDEGRTWTQARTLYDGPDDDRDPSITQLSTGRIICNYFSLRKTESGPRQWTGLGTWMVFSDDNGRTWSEPRQISADYYCSAPVRELSDGRLILGLYTEGGGDAWGAVTLSDDKGMTWAEPIDIDNGGMRLDAETDILEREDGTLYAALRSSRGPSMAYSVSEDGGRTWSTAEPTGFPGHCPYLHRAVNGAALLGVRHMSNTSGLGNCTALHYSWDEGRTWSESVRVDTHHGAYPSMVNLKDGSILIVYYEEGSMSSIRARRFNVTRRGIDWIPVDEGPLPGAALVKLRRIWDEAPHNAFTSLTRFRDQWYCAFREGQGHASPGGALRVLRSDDAWNWTSVARVTSDTADLRDAQLCVTPDDELMLSGAAALHQPAEHRHQTMAYFSQNGTDWSEGVPIGDPDVWLWRVTWHEGTAYGIGYATGDGPDFIRLYKSGTGREFETLASKLREGEYSNESSMVFLEDDTCLCLLRRDSKPPQQSGLLGRSQPPYTEWTWKDLGVRIGGPVMMRIPGGRFVAAVRLYAPKTRTGLCWVDPEKGTLTEFLTLPSGGDTSYPGLVWRDGYLWVSYYASHEGKTSIYMAKVRLDEK